MEKYTSKYFFGSSFDQKSIHIIYLRLSTKIRNKTFMMSIFLKEQHLWLVDTYSHFEALNSYLNVYWTPQIHFTRSKKHFETSLWDDYNKTYLE